MSALDDKGRCCGRKPLFYKGGSWRSPPGAPMHFCCDCNREFGPDGNQRANWAWKREDNGFVRAAAALANPTPEQPAAGLETT